MNKQKFFTLLYVILIIAVILFLIFIIVWLKGIGGSCVKDPIQFFMNKTNQICNCGNKIP